MSDKRFVVLALFLLFLLLAGASPARASEPVGTVTVANGRCVILRGGQSLDAAVNQPVMLKDEVDTDKGAELSILFSDQSRLTLDESSHAAIDTYVFNDSNAEVLFKFTKGTFRAVTGEIVKANPEGFNMETPLATLGIRGSDIYSIVKPDEEEAGALELGEGHALEIKTSKQTMRITKSGMRTRILPTGIIFMPTAIPPSMFNAILRLGASAPSAPAPAGNAAPAQSRSSSEAPAPAQTRSSSDPQAPTTFAAPVDAAPTAPVPMLKTAPTGTATVAPTLKTPATTTAPTVRTPVTTTPTVKTPVTTTPTLKTPVVQPVITPTVPTVKTPVVEPKPTVRPRIRQ